MKKITKKQSTARNVSVPAAPVQPVTPAPVSATLSPQASELVRWYCGISHHRESDAVEGAVFGVLERAKDAYEGPIGGDEAFNFVLEDVIRAMNDETRDSVHHQYGGGFTVRLSIAASALLNRFCETNSYHDDLPPGTPRQPPYDPPED